MKNTYGIETDLELRKVQNACFEILKKFRNVCEENGLRYYLGYGSLLGAVRHHGYIPWDDDIDVWMPRKDLNQFLKLAEKQMYPYIINYYSIENNAAFKYRTQLCIEDHRFRVGFKVGNNVMPGYIWIDVMAMDGMPGSRMKRKIQCIKFSYWYAVIGLARASRMGVVNEKNKKGIKKIGVQINKYLKIGKLIDIKNAFENFVSTKTKYDFDESEYVHGSSSFYTDKAVFKREWFGTGRREEFEGEQFSVPSNAEMVLKTIYGDYMVLPDEDKRAKGHFDILNYKE
ncbi:LicD family protein [Lachnospiraceae bacterium 62-26]